MRATTVAKAQKSPGKCQRCQTVIEVGQGYVWAAAFRSAKKVRCLKPECKFRPSDLEPNDKMASIRAAEENAVECGDCKGGGKEIPDEDAPSDWADGVREKAEEAIGGCPL